MLERTATLDKLIGCPFFLDDPKIRSAFMLAGDGFMFEAGPVLGWEQPLGGFIGLSDPWTSVKYQHPDGTIHNVNMNDSELGYLLMIARRFAQVTE